MTMRRRRGDRGVALVELALIIPIMALLVFGTIDIVRGYRMQIRLESAAREGATFARYRPNDVTCTGDANDIEDHATDEDADVAGFADFDLAVLADDGTGTMSVAVTGCDGTEVAYGERVRIEAAATFELVTPIMRQLLGRGITLRGTAEVEVAQ